MCVVVPLFQLCLHSSESNISREVGSIHIQMIMIYLFCSGLSTILCRAKDGCPP